MWKAPYRPRENDISQSYNDGLVDIYQQTDTASPGYAPKISLRKVCTLAFEEQRLGIQRYYSGKQNQMEVERVLRVQKWFPITNQMVAVIRGQEVQYGIQLVQTVSDVYPASLDLTLGKVLQTMPIAEEDAHDLV